MLIYPTLPKFNQDIKIFFKKLVPGIIGGNVMQINLLVDSIFASMISGAVSYLYYADRINQLPLAMIGIAIGIVLLPSLSRSIKSGKEQEAISLQNKAIEAGLILVVPATLALTVLSYPIISTLFERGAFTAEESFFVAKALMFYSFGLPSFVLVKVIEPAFFARGDTKTPMKIAFICLASNIFCNLFFAKIGCGYVGIILSSVISTYLNLFLLLSFLLGRKHFYFEKGFSAKLVKILIPAFAMAFCLEFLRRYFESFPFNKIIELTIMVVCGILVYAGSSYLSGSLKILDVAKLVGKNKQNSQEKI